MKKSWIIIVFILFMFLPTPAKAEKMLVEVVNDFSSAAPPNEYSLVLSEEIHLKQGEIIEKGSILTGNISQVVAPKRLQKDAYFIFVADTFTIPSEGNKIVNINNKMKSKIKAYGKDELAKDATEVVSSTGLMAASHFVPILNIVVPVVQFGVGMANPKEDECRIHSGCRAIVETWPFYYCLKGSEIDIKSGSKAYFIFNKRMFQQEAI